MNKTFLYFCIFFVISLLFTSCAKKEFLFVPLRIEWFEYTGDLSKMDKGLTPVTAQDSIENLCFIEMTRVLMESPLIQQRADQEISFDTQYYRYQYKKENTIRFLGRLSEPEQQAVLLTEPMKQPLHPENEIGAWTARCNAKGQIRDFAFNGQKTKRQRVVKSN